MEIKFNPQITAPVRPSSPTEPRRVAESAPGVSFETSARLEQALAQVPDVRPEKVEHGRVLASSVKYPPEETIRQLARLLAMDRGRE